MERGRPGCAGAVVRAARLGLAGGVLGFALGGFFDGIMLHQVLQWHHLFSLVPGEAWRDMKNQILMDGWFHVLHYLIALAGLWLLWRARGEAAAPGAGRRLLSAVLLGFAVWQAVDTVVFHWVLSIHRVRVDRPNPLFWDVAWFAVVGGPPLVLGLWLRRPLTTGGDGGSGGRARAATAMLALAVLAAGPVAALPSGGATVALFRSGTGATEAVRAVAAVGGRVLWADPSGELVAFEGAGGAWRLYGRGALLVAGGAGPLPASCLAWLRDRDKGER